MIFFRCLGVVLLLPGVGFAIVIGWDQHHARLTGVGGYGVPWAIALAICSIGIAVLLLRRIAALLTGLGLVVISSSILIGSFTSGRSFLMFAATAIVVIPLLCTAVGIVYCWRELKGW